MVENPSSSIGTARPNGREHLREVAPWHLCDVAGCPSCHQLALCFFLVGGGNHVATA
jgi:hypothetical protein